MGDADACVVVTVRYFAAARATAGVDEEPVSIRPDTTVGELVAQLSLGRCELASVLKRCSYLRDGISVRHPTAVVYDGSTLDVLPPFAGG